MAYRDTARYKKAVNSFLEIASHDIQLVDDSLQAKTTVNLKSESGKADNDKDKDNASKLAYSLVYHRTLVSFVESLDRKDTFLLNDIIVRPSLIHSELVTVTL